MNILLTNDDGYDSVLIRALKDGLGKEHNVIIVAPLTEKSASSHSSTFHKPLRIKKFSKDIYAIDGTPSDCIKIGVLWLKDIQFDLVVSGINAGPNLGIDIHYSGTVAGAREGCIRGLPSIAFSVYKKKAKHNNKYLCEQVKSIINLLVNNNFGENVFFNVNFPDTTKYETFKGTKITHQGNIFWNEYLLERDDPSGEMYYWIGGKVDILEDSEDCDINAVRNGYVSITPLMLDVTKYEIKKKLKKIF